MVSDITVVYTQANRFHNHMKEVEKILKKGKPAHTQEKGKGKGKANAAAYTKPSVEDVADELGGLSL